ncbi:MAG TPA: lipid II flippase MurJ [Planctomycetota bacterium]|nr:lipid II flippase MurJ [Planctomycetota bacterium]
MAAGLLAKLLGVAKNVVLGAWFGTSDGTTDCFVAAFSIITAIYFVGEECIGPAFLPIYMERRDKDGPAPAWQLASTVLNLQFLLLLAAAASVFTYAPQIMDLATRFEIEDEVGKVAGRQDLLTNAASFLRWMAPALFGLSLATVTFMLLNARKKFFWASMGEGSLRAAMTGAVVAFGTQRWLGPWAMPAGVLAGSVAKIATHLPGLWDEIRAHYRLRLGFSDPDFRRFLGLIAPLVIGSVFAKFRDVFNNVYVMSGAGLVGGVSAVYFGRSVVETINSLFPYSLSVGMFPYLCELAEKGDKKALGEMLDRSSRFMVFLFLPAAAVLVVAAMPLADFLFTFKKLQPEDAALIGMVTLYSALAMPFYGIERVMMKGYFSNRRTWAPTIIGIICSALSVAGCYLLITKLGFTGRTALVVVSLAAVGARALKVVLLAANLKRHIPMFEPGATALFALKALALTAAVALAGYGAHELAAPMAEVQGLKGKLALLADMAAIGTASVLAFVVAAWALRMEEWHLAVGWLRPRLAGLLGRIGLGKSGS